MIDLMLVCSKHNVFVDSKITRLVKGKKREKNPACYWHKNDRLINEIESKNQK